LVKQRFDEILQTINSRDSLLAEFDEEIFNALVEKIEILTPTHFVFEFEEWDEGGKICCKPPQFIVYLEILCGLQ